MADSTLVEPTCPAPELEYALRSHLLDGSKPGAQAAALASATTAQSLFTPSTPKRVSFVERVLVNAAASPLTLSRHTLTIALSYSTAT